MLGYHVLKKINLKKIILLFFITLFIANYIFSENIKYSGSRNYIYVERTDLRRYDNGKYFGLLSREIKAYITPQISDDGFLYEGSFYVNQDTRKNVSYVTDGIHEAISSVFKMDENGNVEMIEDKGYPSFRSFPSFPKKEINIGESWEANAIRAVDPLNKNIVTRMPFYIQYTYLRDDIYYGEEVFVVSAKWATRYGASFKNIDENGDPDLVSAYGNHNATICINKENGKVKVVKDTVDETFVYKDNNKVTFKGTVSLFTEYPPVIDEEKILPDIEKVADVDVEKTEAGLLLRLSNLQFKADSSELLPGEEMRLSQIADVLKNLKDSQFLVEGHTASTGNEIGEQKLSFERAYSIVNELVKRGVKPEQFICKGAGSKKPVADNFTPEGKAKNRRVEITILE